LLDLSFLFGIKCWNAVQFGKLFFYFVLFVQVSHLYLLEFDKNSSYSFLQSLKPMCFIENRFYSHCITFFLTSRAKLLKNSLLIWLFCSSYMNKVHKVLVDFLAFLIRRWFFSKLDYFFRLWRKKFVISNHFIFILLSICKLFFRVLE